MERYYKIRRTTSPAPTQPTPSSPTANENTLLLSEFDRHRLSLLSSQKEDEGWQMELRRYLNHLPADVTKDTDIVEWWQVCVRL